MCQTLYPASIPLSCQVGWIVGKETGNALRVGCGRWACYKCGWRKRRRFLERISKQRYDRFITFTEPLERGAVTKANLRAQAAAWGRIRRWLKTRYSAGGYTWVREVGGRTDRLHLHVLVESNYIPQPLLSEACVRYGLGRVVHIERIRHQTSAAHYLGKYLSKQNGAMPRSSRRVQSSAGRLPSAACEAFDYYPLWRWRLKFQEPMQVAAAARAREIELCASIGGRCDQGGSWLFPCPLHLIRPMKNLTDTG